MTAQPSNTNHPNVYFKWGLFSLTFGSSQTLLIRERTGEAVMIRLIVMMKSDNLEGRERETGIIRQERNRIEIKLLKGV